MTKRREGGAAEEARAKAHRAGVRWTVAIAVAVSLSAAAGAAVWAKDPDVVLFYREGCHDCERMDEVLKPLEQQHPDLVVLRLEETANLDLLWRLSSEYGVLPTAFPVIFVGASAIVGVGRDKELELRNAVEDCVANGCVSPLTAAVEPRIPWTLILLGALAAVVLVVVLL